MSMINWREYIEYLISTADNDTCSNLAEPLDSVSHDAVSGLPAMGQINAAQPMGTGKSFTEG